MNKDDESRTPGRLGQALPGYSALSEAFGAAIDASRMTRARAKQLAERLLAQTGLDNVNLGEAASEASSRINQLAEEIIAARKANQALLQRTISAELEKSLHRLGLARADEVAALRDEIAVLRSDLASMNITGLATPTAGKKAAARKRATTNTPAKKSAMKKATAKKTAGKKTAAKKTAADTSPATAAAVPTSPAGTDDATPSTGADA